MSSKDLAALTDADLTRGSTPPDIAQQCLMLCQMFLDLGWTQAKTNDVEVSRITGGLTNQIYRVRLKNHVKCEENRDVVVKFYQSKHLKSYYQTNERLIDGLVDKVVSDLNIAPKLLGIFNDGVIYEYIKHRRFEAEYKNNDQLMRDVAYKLAQIHHLDIPMPKNPGTWFRDQMKRNIKQANQAFNIQAMACEFNLPNLSSRNLLAEFEKMETILKDTEKPIVLCHNDFRRSNIMILPNLEIRVCDFEDVCFGPRGYDLASFLGIFGVEIFTTTEWHMPDEQLIAKFVGFYLEACNQIKPGYTDKPENNLSKVICEVKLNLMASFMYFIALIINQTESVIQSIPFDYKILLGQIEKSFKFYLQTKQELYQDGTITN